MRGTAKKMALVGAGAGIVLFAIFGLLPGSFLGGVLGLNIAGSLFGYPVSPGIMPRMIVAASMLVGVMVSAVIFVVSGSFAGWLLGMLVDMVVSPAERAAEKTKP